MKHFNSLMAGLVLALILAGFPAQAQQPILGARLLVAEPGGISASYIGATGQLAVDWQATFGWSTGPGPTDFMRFTELAEQGFYGHLDGTSRNLSATMAMGIPLPANTLVFAESVLFSPRIGADGARWDLVHTGLYNKQIAFPGLTTSSASAAVVALPGNMAIVGFPLAPASSPFASIFDYSIRILITNVCVR